MRVLRLGLLLLLPLPGAIAPLAGCSMFEAQTTMRGNKVDADLLKELVPGTSTRADATALIGSPTARASFDDNQWLYISEVTQPRIGRTPGVLTQQVVILTFDDQGVLRGITSRDAADSRPVDVVARTTPAPGSEASFLQQLFGNIGRFSTGTGGSAPLSGGLGP